MKHGNFTLRLSQSAENQVILTKYEKKLFAIEKISLIDPSQKMVTGGKKMEDGLLYSLAECGKLNATRVGSQKNTFEYVVIYVPTGKKFSVQEGRIIIS
jgi:hypothetical protein